MLNQPYPISEVTSRSVWGAVLAGIFVAAFLLFFQPFDLSRWSDPYKWLKVSGYGVITTGVLCIDFYLIKKNCRAIFDEKQWTVWKEILWTVFILLSVTLGNYLYNAFLFPGQTYHRAFWNTMLTTFSIGIFPTTAFVLINYILQLRKYTQPVKIHPITVHEAPPSLLELIAENGKDRITFLSQELLYIESCDNYATVYLLRNQAVQKELIRSSLTRLEGQLSHPEMARCHRSFVVNLMHVQKVSGNAQGYKLHLAHLDTHIPVARKYASVILDKI